MLKDCIGTAKALADFAKAEGIAEDWHEPDGITAVVRGRVLDNAGGGFLDTDGPQIEKVVVVRGAHGTVIVNLATVLALAAGMAKKPQSSTPAKPAKTFFVLTYYKGFEPTALGVFKSEAAAREKLAKFVREMVEPADIDLPNDVSDAELLRSYFDEGDGDERYEIDEREVES